MEKKLKTKNTKPETTMDNEGVIDKSNIGKAQNEVLVNFQRLSRLIWFSIIILAITLLATSSYLYFENRRFLTALEKALLEQERIYSLLSEEELAKSTRKQFDKMYLDMITPDLERKTSVLEEKLNDFKNEIGTKVPTMDNMIKEFQPLLNTSLIEIENKLRLEVSNRFDNLNNLAKELSEDLSLSGEMNIDPIIKELDNLNEKINELKSANQDFQEQIIKNYYEKDQLDKRLSKIESTSNTINQKTNSESLYTEVQEILSMLPDLTVYAIREEYISKTLRETNDSLWGRLKAFFGSRVISRSLQPKEGNSVDSIMSRVEFALTKLDLNKSLVELKGLPENTSHIFSDLVERIENLTDDQK